MLEESIYTSELGIAFEKGTHEEVAARSYRNAQRDARMRALQKK